MNYIGICDDNLIELKVSKVYIEEIMKELNREVKIETFQTGAGIIAYARENKLQIVFLDIDMGKESGIETAKSLKRIDDTIIIIFLTGHNEYALKAFDIEAFGYLVKPIQLSRLKRCLSKGLNQIILENQKENNTYFTFTEENIKKRILQRKIFYIEKVKNQCILYTSEGQHTIYDTIKSILVQLDKDFLQINQGIVVQKRYIKQIVQNDVFLKNGIIFSLGRNYKKMIKDTFFEK